MKMNQDDRINEIKTLFDNHEITSSEINNEDKAQILKMYKVEIDELRNYIKDLRTQVDYYMNKINKMTSSKEG